MIFSAENIFFKLAGLFLVEVIELDKPFYLFLFNKLVVFFRSVAGVGCCRFGIVSILMFVGFEMLNQGGSIGSSLGNGIIDNKLIVG